jgi:hypothetical protein
VKRSIFLQFAVYLFCYYHETVRKFSRAPPPVLKLVLFVSNRFITVCLGVSSLVITNSAHSWPLQAVVTIKQLIETTYSNYLKFYHGGHLILNVYVDVSSRPSQANSDVLSSVEPLCPCLAVEVHPYPGLFFHK